MSLYPSLEDMVVDKMAQAQTNASAQPAAIAAHPAPPQTVTVHGSGVTVTHSLYPSLNDFMGLEMSDEVVRQHMAVIPQPQPQSGPLVAPGGSQVVAPVSGSREVGIMRSQIKQGVREVILCKDAKGKVGLALKSISKGVFVAFVYKGSAASQGGLRFGDQILQINGEVVAGYSEDKVNKVIKKAAPGRITFAVRDRPFERTITMQKDSSGGVGFAFNKGEIKQIIKDSSAARNGILIDHNLVEVNGQNCVGLKDKDIHALFDLAPRTCTVTIMPVFVYQHMVKSLGNLKKYMDHSVPEI